MTPPTFRPRALIAALLTAALALAVTVVHAAPLADPPLRYPRLGLPGCIHGDGSPYLDSLGTLVPSVIDPVSRYDTVILDASPITEYHPEILAALRARNPRLKALAYVTGHDIWEVNSADSLVHFPTRYNHLVRDLGGYLYDRRGNKFPTADVNIAKRDGSGRFVVAEAVANLFVDAIASTGLWDGFFVDVFCNDIEWAQTPSESIDVVRAGYPDLPRFTTAWKAASDTMASILRRRCPPGTILVGNCGQGTKYVWFNGWTRENFPFQNGGTWYSNMYRDPGGYFTDEARFQAPTTNVIFTPMDDPDPFDAIDRRRERLGLGSAALGTGIATFGPFDRKLRTPPHDTWWYDEYAVDVASGRASTRLEDTGWLGEALGPPYQMIWVGTNPDASSNPGFETNVTDGWWLYNDPAVPTTLVRDSTDSAVGGASARLTMATAGSVPWSVAFATTNRIAISPWVEYAATFWARASQPRALTVALAAPGASYALRTVQVGTAWQQYQVVLVPQTTATSQLHFMLGAAAGDVWLDDVHLQQGATTLYRRDFQNGTVLVNPAAQAMTVPLGRPFQRILGTVDPFVNDGSIVTTVTVGASDALFLIGNDVTPPEDVRDLHLGP